MRVYFKPMPSPRIMMIRRHENSPYKGYSTEECHIHDLYSIMNSVTEGKVMLDQSNIYTEKDMKSKIAKEDWIKVGGYYSSACYDKNLQELSIATILIRYIFLTNYLTIKEQLVKDISSNVLQDLKNGLVGRKYLGGIVGDIFKWTNVNSLPEEPSENVPVGSIYRDTFISLKNSFLNYIKTLEKEGKTMEKTNVVIGVGVTVVHKQTAQITKIVVNKPDRCVVVFFKDGKQENVKCSPEDEFDPYVGVAIAKARHEFGSTSAFHRAVDSIALVVEPKKKAKKAKTVKKSSVKTTKTTK